VVTVTGTSGGGAAVASSSSPLATITIS
jgi:hypothetical protein